MRRISPNLPEPVQAVYFPEQSKVTWIFREKTVYPNTEYRYDLYFFPEAEQASGHDQGGQHRDARGGSPGGRQEMVQAALAEHHNRCLRLMSGLDVIVEVLQKRI